MKITFDGFEGECGKFCSISGGGQSSNGSSQQQSTSGFNALSPQIQQVFNQLATTAGQYIPGTNAGGSTANMYTPLPQTAGETSAINAINAGFNPTASQLNSSIAEQMNPYNSGVLSQIQQQAYGQNSALNQQLTQAGQFGSNRAALGANDIANTQAANINSFLGGQYNTALNNALTTIPQLNEQSAQAQLGAGQFQRSLAAQTAQAPLTGLAAIAQILGVLPTNAGQSTGSSNQSSQGYNGAFNPFSDMRLKENVVAVGKQNGFTLYKFNYKGGYRKFIGAMAQEVEKLRPDAVKNRDGYKTIDYEAIGLKMVEV